MAAGTDGVGCMALTAISSITLRDGTNKLTDAYSGSIEIA